MTPIIACLSIVLIFLRLHFFFYSHCNFTKFLQYQFGAEISELKGRYEFTIARQKYLHLHAKIVRTETCVSRPDGCGDGREITRSNPTAEAGRSLMDVKKF